MAFAENTLRATANRYSSFSYLKRDLASIGRRNAIGHLRQLVELAPHNLIRSRGVFRVLIHFLAEPDLSRNDLRLIKRLLKARPELAVPHMWGGLNVHHKSDLSGARRRYWVLLRLLQRPEFVSPVAVRYGVAHLGAEASNAASWLLSSRPFLGHADARKELAHQLVAHCANGFGRPDVHADAAWGLLLKLMEHDGFREDLQRLFASGRMRFHVIPGATRVFGPHDFSSEDHRLSVPEHMVLKKLLSP